MWMKCTDSFEFDIVLLFEQKMTHQKNVEKLEASFKNAADIKQAGHWNSPLASSP